MEAIQSIFGGQNPGLTLVMLVLGLFALLVFSFWLFRKISGSNTLKTGRNRQPRLSVTDAAIVDDKRRLVLVRRDNVEHLVMIGGPSDIVIEQNINRILAPQSAQRETQIAQRETQISQRETQIAQRETLARELQNGEPPTASSTTAVQRLRQPAPRQRIEAATSMAAANGVARPEQEPAAAMPEAEMASAPYDPEPARREAPSIVHNELDIADFEFDLAGELERDIAQPVAANQAPPAQPSLEDALSSELADDMDFAKMLGKDTQSGPGITTPEPAAVQPKPRRRDNVDDEMQRLLDELASA